MSVRVVRVIQYSYPDLETAEADMARWGIPANGSYVGGIRGDFNDPLETRRIYTIRSAVIPPHTVKDDDVPIPPEQKAWFENTGEPERPAGFPYGEFDAMKWADEFWRIWGKQMPGGPDRETMFGWFANAIMTGFDKAHVETARLQEIISKAIQITSDAKPLPARGSRKRVLDKLNEAWPDARVESAAAGDEPVNAEPLREDAASAPQLQACPICGNTAMVRLAADWQQQNHLSIPIIGCGNPWHYVVPEAKSLGDLPDVPDVPLAEVSQTDDGPRAIASLSITMFDHQRPVVADGTQGMRRGPLT